MIDATAQPVRTLPELRADLALLNGAMAQLEADMRAARAAEDDTAHQLGALDGRIGALLNQWHTRVIDMGGDVVVDGAAPPAVKREILQLVRQRRAVLAQRQEWVTQHSVQASDPGGMAVSKSLTPSNIVPRLALCRRTRDRVAHDLAEAEAAVLPAEPTPPGPADRLRAWLT